MAFKVDTRPRQTVLPAHPEERGFLEMLHKLVDAPAYRRNHRKWLLRFRFDSGACESLWGDIRTAILEGKTIARREGYADALWHRQGHERRFRTACPRARKKCV